MSGFRRVTTDWTPPFTSCQDSARQAPLFFGQRTPKRGSVTFSPGPRISWDTGSWDSLVYYYGSCHTSVGPPQRRIPRIAPVAARWGRPKAVTTHPGLRVTCQVP